MSARKPVTPGIYAKWERLKKEVEQCAFDVSESNGAQAKRQLWAAIKELGETTVAVHELRRLTDPQLIKELASKVVKKIGRGGDALAAHRVVTELLVEVARRDFDEWERLRGLGVTVRRSPRFQRYADPRVVTAMVDAAVASTRAHPRLEESKSKQRRDERLTKALRANPEKTAAECRRELNAQRRTKGGTSAPDEHVFVAAWLVRATTADNAATYQSQVRDARKR